MEPKIRFNNTCWQKHKVGDLCDLLTGYPFPGDKILNRGKNLLMRGINITEGRIRHSDEIDRYYNEDTIGLEKYRLQVGDLVIGMDGSKVGKNSALVTSKENNSLLVQRVARLRNEDKNLINLIQIAVGSDKFIKYVEEMKTSSAIPHISPADIRNFPLSLPEDSNERRLIASYFTSLDSQISASTSRLASLKQMKAASLQAMFPQKGETVPKVRFKGFEGEWKKVKVSTLLEERREFDKMSDEYPLMAFIANIGVADKGDRYDRSSLVNDIENKLYKKTDLGDFIYSSNNLETGSIGLNRYGKATISPVYSIFKCTDKSNYDFIGCAFTRKEFINNMVKWRQGVMYGQWRIHESDFFKIEILVPSIDEQRCIGDYFTSLDHQITLQTHRLEKLKQIKSACLDKMFV